jgi:outer membrane protein OmpA-like peptidoglycan-associated protein
MHKNYLKSIFLPAIISLFVGNLSAQGQGSMGVEVNGGYREYLGDMGSSLFFTTKPIYQGGGATFTYGISPSFDGVANISAGDVGFCRSFDSFVKEKDIIWKSFKANTADLSFGVRYKLNNGVILSEDSKFAPYLYGAIGAYYVHSKIKWGPDPYVAATRIDQWGVSHPIENTIQDIGAQVQGGLGFKYILTEKIAISWSYVLTYTFNDRWDGSNDADPNPDKPLVNKLYRSNDAWGYNNIGVAFALNEGSGGGGRGPKRMKDTDEDGVPDKYDRCKGTEAKYRKYVDSLGCPADTDGDGILDADDKCAEEKGTKELNGCPDSDGDGIENKLDVCPNVKGTPEFNGCPDSDGDGIADNVDGCPNEKGSKELNGCPDTDGDGIANAKDKCPDVAGTVTGEGCPDTDGDGVYNNIDKCPDVAGIAANKGCPEVKKETVQKIALAAKGINFETNKDLIVAASFKTLDALAKLLNSEPNANVEIQGHTDNVGDATTNKELSQKRAEAVKRYLINAGVAESRMSPVGYGSEMPIADNSSAIGKEKNRRVDFKLSF